MKTIRVLLGILTVTLALSPQVHAQAPFTNSLVAYYPFNGGVVVTDESGNGNDGEIVGNDWRFGLDGLGTESALYLNTTDPINNNVGTYVEAPQITGLDFNQDFTLSVWVNIPDGLPAYHVHNLVSDGPDSSSANFRIISNAETNGDDYLQFTGHPTGGDGDIHMFLAPIRNVWWQAAVVRSGSIVSLFQNGAQVTNWLVTTPLINGHEIWLGSMPLTTNEMPSLGEYPLDGGIDNVRIYNRALSALEVQQLYAYEFPTATVALTVDPTNGGVATGGGTFIVGSQAAISATAYTGWTFTGWNDGNAQNPRTITVPSGGAFYVANFEFVPTTASYSGLFYDTSGVAFQSSGFFSLTLTPKGTFSAKIQSAGEVYPFSGSFSWDGLASNSVLLSKSDRLTILLGFNSGGQDILSGQMTGVNWTAALLANRAVYSTTNLAPQAGKYTLLFPGSSDASAQPGGDGFGAVTVDHFGNLSFTGTLGDGGSVSQTAVVSGRGQWPFYVSLYSGKGSILGWLNFTNLPESDIAGAATWTKLQQTAAKFYPAGFTNQTEAVGSSFQFTNNVPVLSFAAGELWLTNGNLAEGITNQFALGKNSQVTDTNKMILAFSTASGLFTGSVVNPATKRTILIHGAVLQKQNIGAGYFLGTNESGEVFLGAAP